jgi:hypothetical protein
MVARMVEGTGHSADGSKIREKRRITMFKTIFVAVLAVSVLAAPALAATGKATTQTAVIKTTQSKAAQSKANPVKTSVLNANAKAGKHHLKYGRHHDEHKKIAMRRTHPNVSYKHTLPAVTKRG